MARFHRRGRGKVYTSKDFLDLGSRAAVDQTLSRMVANGALRRLGRGLYHFPRTNVKLGIELAPDVDEIAQALARRTGSRVVPSGAVAANWLGLSTQVPARPIYLTDGRTREVRVGKMVVVLRHAPPKDLPLGSPTSAMVFQALRHLGKDAVPADTLARIRERLTVQERQRLVRDGHHITDWIAEAVRRIATGSDGSPEVPRG